MFNRIGLYHEIPVKFFVVYWIYKIAINNPIATSISIPDSAITNDIIDTSSLFYDLLFAGNVATAGLNSLEKSILLKVETSLSRPADIAMNVVRLPSILTRVEALVRCDDYTPEQLSALISQDPVLAADVIKLVNSAYYQRGQQEITNLATAVVRLGGHKINELVLTVVMQNIADIKPIYFKLFGKYLWDHSLTTAIWAQKLAKDRGGDADLAYFLGLIHDVGKIALFKLIVEEMHLSDPELGTNSKLFRQMMTKHSLRLSALIAQAWLLPGGVVKALQEQGAATAQRDRTLAGQILHEANLYSEIYLLMQQGILEPQQATEFCLQNGLDIDACLKGIAVSR